MLNFILAPILNFLGGPVIAGAISAYKAKLAAGNTQERIAADLAGKELQVQQREIEVQNQLKIAEIGHWYEPDHLFGYIMVLYLTKAILIDKVIASFFGADWTTDPLKGDLSMWAGMIMAFYVGMRGIQNVARIIKR